VQGQRRWCPKEFKTNVEKYSVIMSKQDMVGTMVDPRLCHGTHLNKKQLEEAMDTFCEEYAKYAITAFRFEKLMNAGSATSKSIQENKKSKVYLGIFHFKSTF